MWVQMIQVSDAMLCNLIQKFFTKFLYEVRAVASKPAENSGWLPRPDRLFKRTKNVKFEKKLPAYIRVLYIQDVIWVISLFTNQK